MWRGRDSVGAWKLPSRDRVDGADRHAASGRGWGCLPGAQKNIRIITGTWIRATLLSCPSPSLGHIPHEFVKMRASRAVAVLSDGRILSSSPGAKLLNLSWSCRASSDAPRQWQQPVQFDGARSFSQSFKRGAALNAAQEAYVVSDKYHHQQWQPTDYHISQTVSRPPRKQPTSPPKLSRRA